MTAWLGYWKNDQMDLAEPGETLEHAAANQFDALKVGDRLFISSVRDGRMVLVGAMTVGRVLTHAEAERHFKSRDIYEADFHALAAPRSASPVVKRDVTALAPKIRFDSPTPTIDMQDGAVTGQALRTMRPLTAESTQLLEAVLQEEAPTEEAPAKGKQHRNPDWDRDELILALDLYFHIDIKKIGERHPEIIKLSKILNDLPLHVDRGPDFRNPNGVAMKLANFARLDPNYRADGRKGLSGGAALEKEIWLEFANDRERLAATAAAIRAGYEQPEAAPPRIQDEDEQEFPEGKVLYRLHRARERNNKLIEAAKKRALKKFGVLKCIVCDFDFAITYGDLGDGYIEAHHTLALSDAEHSGTTRVQDLALVCANCHRMIHRRRPWLDMTQLRQLLIKDDASA